MARRRQGRRGNNEGSICETVERGKKIWMAQVTIPQDVGPAKRRKLRGRTYDEVKAKRDELLRQVADGTTADTDTTLAAHLQETWLPQKRRTVKPSTFEQYRYCVAIIAKQVGKLRLDKLTPRKCQALITKVADENGVHRANKCLVVLHNAYREAVRLQLVGRNPAEAVDSLPVPTRDLKLWTPEQAIAFLDVAKAHRLYAFFYAAMATGLRRGELLGLRWEDISGSSLFVRQTRVKLSSGVVVDTPKSAKAVRRVSLSPDVLLVLAEHKQRQEGERERLAEYWPDTGLVFVSELGEPLDPESICPLRNRLMEKAKVPRVSLHDLRHLHASFAILNGMDAKVLADRLGHTRASFTLDRYTHLFEQQRDVAAVSLEDFLAKAAPARDAEQLN